MGSFFRDSGGQRIEKPPGKCRAGNRKQYQQRFLGVGPLELAQKPQRQKTEKSQERHQEDEHHDLGNNGGNPAEPHNSNRTENFMYRKGKTRFGELVLGNWPHCECGGHNPVLPEGN